MRDETLIKISALTFCIGIISLLIFSPKPRDITTSLVSRSLIDSYVRIEGTAHEIDFSENGVSFIITDSEGSIRCFIYASLVSDLISQGKDIIHLSEGDRIAISGNLIEYQGDMEIVPKSIDDVLI